MSDIVFITGAERSGATIIARAFKECGAWTGATGRMAENFIMHAYHRVYRSHHPEDIFRDTKRIPPYREVDIKNLLLMDGFENGVGILKSSELTRVWPLWHFYYPDGKWVIVRRKTAHIINSCVRTGHMRLMKDPSNLKKVGVDTEEAGWLWWVHRYEQEWRRMIAAGLQYKEVWPDRAQDKDYTQMSEVAAWCGLEWNDSATEVVRKLINGG